MDQNSDTQISYLVAHLGKDGLDLRVDRRALGPDVLTEAVNVVYRGPSGVRTRDGHTELPIRVPLVSDPNWPTVRGCVDGPNEPWAWTGAALVSAPVPGAALPETTPADAAQLYLPHLTELVPSSKKTDQLTTGLGAVSVDLTSDGLCLLWLATPTAVEGWHVELDEKGRPSALLTRRFSVPVTSVTQLRALCVNGVHHVFFLDAGLLQGYRWFQGGTDLTHILTDGVGISAFDLLPPGLGAAGNPYLLTASGTALAALPLDPLLSGSALYLTSPLTVVEMAVTWANGLLVWAVSDQVNGVRVYTSASGGAWSGDLFLTLGQPGPPELGAGGEPQVDGLSVVTDGTTIWLWVGFTPAPSSLVHYTELFTWTSGPGWSATNFIPDSCPASGAFLLHGRPALWMNRPGVGTVDNQVGWLHIEGLYGSSVGASAYQGYGLAPGRVVLPPVVQMDTGGELWTCPQGAPAFKYLAGLLNLTPPVVSPGTPVTQGDGPCVLLTLDFSQSGAPLSQARLGGAVYLAGGQPHGFDGRGAYEAGFNGYPIVTNEVTTTLGAPGPPSLDNGDTRQYRAYLVWRNAAGELMYSDSDIYTSQQAAVVGGGQSAQRTLTFSFSCPASELYGRAWVEVYATTGGGGVIGDTFYQILSEGNGVYLYQGGHLSFTLVDSLSDALLSGGQRAADPYNPSLTAPFNLAPGYWPACEGLAWAGDRLWLYGGLVEPGSLSFTKLRSFGVAAEHTSEYGLLEVTSQEDPVEWVAPYQDSVLAVAGGSVWAFGGLGPDNTGLGSFSGAVRVTGGVTGVKRSVLSNEGTWLLSLSGCLLLGPGLAVQDVSAPVAAALAAELGDGDVLYAEYDAPNREVRWYMTTGTVFVLDRNLDLPRWAIWRLPRVTGGSLAANLLVTQDGRWLDTTPGVPTDAGHPIQASVSTSDLTPAEGSWVRFRHFLVAGKWLASSSQGKVTVTAHYDGADYRTTLFWTDGPDNSRPLDQWFGRSVSSTQDGLLRHRNRFARQRGSSVRLRLVVTGAPALLSQVTVDVTQPNGLARLPAK